MYTLKVQTAFNGDGFKTDRTATYESFEQAQEAMDKAFRRYVEKPQGGPVDGFEIVIWARMVAIVRSSIGIRLFTIHEE